MYDLFCSFSGNLPKSVGSFWRNCGVDVASYNGDNDGDDDDDPLLLMMISCMHTAPRLFGISALLQSALRSKFVCR